MVHREAEPDPIEVGFSERHVVRPLDPLARVEPSLLDEPSVDPDQVPQRLVLGVVGADERRSVIAISGDHHDLVRRPRISLRGRCENDDSTHTQQQQAFQDPSPSMTLRLWSLWPYTPNTTVSVVRRHASTRAVKVRVGRDGRGAPFRGRRVHPLRRASA